MQQTKSDTLHSSHNQDDFYQRGDLEKENEKKNMCASARPFNMTPLN